MPLLESCSTKKDQSNSPNNLSIEKHGLNDVATQTKVIPKNKPIQISTPPPPPSIHEERKITFAPQSKMRSKDMFDHDGVKVYASPEENTESYETISENKFKSSIEEPLSTFSLDVDRASYSNVRRMLLNGNIPPKNAVRIEEMINYFNYQYPEPEENHPIAIHTTLSECPWNKNHHLMHVGIQGKRIKTEHLPPSNLVFLMDVSGSMNRPNKLPLVKSALKMLLNQLRPEDRVAIVTYAGSAGIALESTPISEKQKIFSALDHLSAGGSTAGAEGIITAYKIAKENFIKGGNNRVILTTDGDFNVGVNSPSELEELIEEKRKSNIYLSVLGFGTGNYKDHQMQVLADKGNGNHAYIDNMLEAQKILVNEFGGTLFTIAKDVKIQIEFNPAYASAYRLIGYENRILNKEDFNDDTKDAGEIGSGHSMTAIYEIIPAGVNSNLIPSVDELKYQLNSNEKEKLLYNQELATLKFRYKLPEENVSRKIVTTISPKPRLLQENEADINLAFAVAEFGMILRESNYLQNSSIDQIINLCKFSNNEEKIEFLKLVNIYKNLKNIQ